MPTLSTIAPVIGVQGTTVPATLTGTNFVPGATVAVDNPGIAVSAVNVVSATQITVTFTIAANATPGAANVTVRTSGGTSAAVLFTVNPSAPTLTSISPASAAQGTTVPITLIGTNFIPGATVTTDDPQISVSNVTIVSATQISATLNITVLEMLGTAHLTVATSGGSSNPVLFTVTFPPPTLTSPLMPASGQRGSLGVMVILTGHYFVTGATVTVTNPGITVSDVTVASTTRIIVNFDIAAAAPLGPANVTVTTSLPRWLGPSPLAVPLQ